MSGILGSILNALHGAFKAVLSIAKSIPPHISSIYSIYIRVLDPIAFK
jgi:hypothetical protein